MNILIIKTGALGDVVRTSFIAQALKNKYKKQDPNIFWLTNKNAKPLFVNNPYITKIISESKENKEKLIKKDRFDLVVNLEESKELCKFTSSLKPKKIQGFYFDLNKNKIVPSSSTREWFNMSAIGPKPENDKLKKNNKKTHREIMSDIIGLKNHKRYEPFLRLSNKQRKIASNFLKKHNLSKKDLIIGVNTGSADRWPKQLPIKKTVKLIDKLHKNFNAKILLFGGPNEVKRNKKIHSLSKSPIIDTGCSNNLIEFPALISVCNLFITTDTLGLHAALSLKRKTICLVGPTSPQEIDMYGLGKKVVANSKCVCCYSSDCKSMKKINIKEIIKKTKKLLDQKITLLITAFKEPSIGKALESAINQKTSKEYEILVSAPDKETLDIVKKYQKKSDKIKIFKDSGKGKSYALNMIFKKLDTDIIILTDGDVRISENTIEEMINAFSNPEIGCVTGKPVPEETKETMFGYWANFLFDCAHKIRKDLHNKNDFLECSGYLFAFRKKKIKKIPLDVAEDTIIPYIFWEKGYRTGYVPEAKVYVKNVNNLSDWIKQKIRTSKAHETLEKYVDIQTTPRVKTFGTETKGVKWLFKYPDNLKQLIWSSFLAFSRFYMWLRVFYDTRLKNNQYKDAWERVESTK